jgi:BON domain-containing protein
MKLTTILFAAALGAGCYHETTGQPTTARQEQRLEDALVQARYGSASGPWRPSGLYIEKLDDGGVRVTKGEKWDARVPVKGVSNAWITTKVKSEFATDSDVHAFDINVDTDDSGLVSLRGHVSAPYEAAKAIRDAISVQGVNAVDSYLTW